jgi:hypothetical protein
MPLMEALLAALLAATAPAARPTPVVQYEEPAPAVIRPVEGVDGLTALCRMLAPPAQLRPAGDAVDRGEAISGAEQARHDALAARWQIRVPAAKLAFAPFDGPERRLELAEPSTLALGSHARLWPVAERGLAVEVDAGVARQILDAQRRGSLVLALTFDLPEEAGCGADQRVRSIQLPVDPVEWRWLDGDRVLARGGAAADRPAVDVAAGAKPKVDVGEPIAGTAEMKKAVVARSPELLECYRHALEKDPAVDGVLVVELSASAGLTIAADSTGADDLPGCVSKALATLAPPAAGKAAVPIRFELVPPTVRASPAAR